MTDVEHLTIEILKQIRDEVRSTREELGARIDQTNARLDQTNVRLDQTNARLGAVDATLVDLAVQQRFIVRNVKRSASREKAYREDLDDLKRRVDDIEARLHPKDH